MPDNKLQKLELTWIGKGEEPKLEPRILIENPEYSYLEGKEEGALYPRGGDQEGAGANMLIHGDNLLALKALEQDFTGKIKCIYIDPPYNTGNAFEHYDDGVEHSQWLNLMSPRLKLLRNLLSNDRSIWIQTKSGPKRNRRKIIVKMLRNILLSIAASPGNMGSFRMMPFQGPIAGRIWRRGLWSKKVK